MANTLGVYNPQFYANEALIWLQKALGLAGRVYLGFDEERRSFRLGDTVNIRRPSTFTAADAPSAAQDVTSPTVSVVLNKWKDVPFGLTDKELAFTGERIINDHIMPAAYAIADAIDQDLSTLIPAVPHFFETTGSWATTAAADLAGIRKVMFDNLVPLRDSSNVHLMVSGTLESELLANAAFTQQQGAGDAGISTQRTGMIGPKYGFNVWANQNTGGTYTKGVAADQAGAVNNVAGYAVNSTSIAVDALTIAGVYKKGDVVKFTGHTKKYALAADATMDGGGAGTLVLAEGLQKAVIDNEIFNITTPAAAGPFTNMSAAFHRNAFALVTAPLSMMGNELGARMAIAQDPVTGLSIRSRLYYDGANAKVNVVLDALYGFKLLDGDLAVRVLDAA